MNIKNNDLFGLPVERFPKYFFDGIAGYNQLMMLKEFYKRFELYKYILIYQLDAFVFSDQLLHFCKLEYDYIGAPWLRGHRYINGLERKYLYVGNGGFSLRKVHAFCRILDNESVRDISEPEDVFWASRKGLKIAPVEVAVSFSFEEQVKKSFELNHRRLPFGCHAWFKFDFKFFRPYMQQYGYALNDIAFSTLDEEWSMNKYKKCCLDVDRKTMLETLKVLGNGEDTFNAAVFGVGRLGEECYKILTFVGIEIVCCIDNDKEKQGQYLWKHKIISLEQFADMGKTEETIIIVAVGRKYCDEVVEQINSLYNKGKQTLILYKDLKAEIEKRLNDE
ncbi:MAG: hypothetical protein K2K70_08460 [Lachnospiraceae bacterium]|nr:hypothetical protein [Lachnospiraceae bacterium]